MSPSRGTPSHAPIWVPRAAVLAIHDMLIAQHGGAAGMLDEDGLEAAVAAPLQHLAYAKDCDLFDLAAAYASAITRRHPMRDGNKRLALTVAGVFLELNGRRLEAPEADAVRAILALVTRDLDDAGFARWLRDRSVTAPRGTRRRRRGL